MMQHLPPGELATKLDLENLEHRLRRMDGFDIRMERFEAGWMGSRAGWMGSRAGWDGLEGRIDDLPTSSQ